MIASRSLPATPRAWRERCNSQHPLKIISVARRPVAMQEQVAAPPARVGVAGAMQHAQCGINNAGSFGAPQPIYSPIRARA